MAAFVSILHFIKHFFKHLSLNPKKQVHNVSKLYTHYDIPVGCGLGLVRIDWRVDFFPVVWRIFPIVLSADFLHSLQLCIFSGAAEEGENDD